MPRTWYFPRWRHLLMQIVMWLVLGGTLALAAMLDSHLRRVQAIEFAPAISDDTFSFQFPADWKSWTRQSDANTATYVASDSSAGAERTLTVTRQRLPRAIPPAEYILRADPLTGDRSPEEFKGITLDGWPGQSINWEARRAMGVDSEFQFSFCTAVVLPNDQAILIRLDKSGPIDPGDRQLYQQMLDRVHIAAARPIAGGTIQLAHNISVSILSELSLYPASDPLREERMAAMIDDDGAWISAEFVPVAIPGNEPSNSLVAGLCAREQLDPRDPGLAYRWLRAGISAEGPPNRWTIQPPDSPNDAIAPRRIAHLLTGDGGWGLLVILSAEPPASTADPESLWDELPAKIHIAKSQTLDADLQTGANIARAASAPQQAAVVADAPWWLWSRTSIPIGYSQSDSKYAVRYTVRRNWNGTVTAAFQQWGVTSDTGQPVGIMKRSDAEAGPSDPLVPLYDEFTTVSADAISTIINGPGRTEAPSSIPFTSSFVMSRYLPSLLSHVQTQAAIWTDRFPAVEAELFPSPLLLVARRCPDVGNLRCVEADVNGTGALSRWYFRADGTLDHADFAGDLHLRPTTAGEVQSAFAGDRRLTILPH
jgi:hypothetical protein